MQSLIIYNSPARAKFAAAYLCRHGIIARAVDAGVQAYSVQAGDHVVMIVDEERRDEALRLLAEIESQPAQTEQPLTDAARPDLSALDSSFSPPCPGCGTSLPLDAAIAVCPVCQQPVDVAELIVKAHGPEVLCDCYPEPIDDIPSEVLASARLTCHQCAYSLDGLPHRGVCPECGQPYSKIDILRGPQ